MNGPAYAQKPVQIVGTKLNWDTTSPAPLSGEVDGLVVVTQQGGPAGTDSTNNTRDTSAELIVSKNNHDGFSNVTEGQAQQWPVPGQNPDAEIDVQLGDELAAHQGGVGLSLNDIYNDPNIASGTLGDNALNMTAASGAHWSWFVRAGTATGLNWSVDGSGNEYMAGNIQLGYGKSLLLSDATTGKNSYLFQDTDGFVKISVLNPAHPTPTPTADFMVTNFQTTTVVASGLITANGGVILPVSTVAALPACNSSSAGEMRSVSDATAPTYNGALSGGGTVKVPVFCNGTAWTSH